MGTLIKNEFKKYSNSYINIVSFATMIFPLIFTSLIYRFTDSFSFTWQAYINSLHLFYGIFFGSLIPSFVAIFSVYYEFREGTMKNLVCSPFGREKIIVSKMLYVSIFIMMLYVAVAFLVALSGVLIGFETSPADILNVLKSIMIPGLTTVVFVPFMIFVTLVFKTFVVPVVITFIGIVVGIPIINLGESYLYPWMIPSNFFFKVCNPDAANFLLPVIVFGVYIMVFFVLAVLRFRKMDFD